jgi:hypothetical protein
MIMKTHEYVKLGNLIGLHNREKCMNSHLDAPENCLDSMPIIVKREVSSSLNSLSLSLSPSLPPLSLSLSLRLSLHHSLSSLSLYIYIYGCGFNAKEGSYPMHVVR